MFSSLRNLYAGKVNYRDSNPSNKKLALMFKREIKIILQVSEREIDTEGHFKVERDNQCAYNS